MSPFESIFWISLVVVAYVYFGYPVTLYLLPVRRAKINSDFKLPSVSIVTAAYNEAQHIGTTISNKLDLDYPPDKLEMIVVSDESEDGTDDIVQSFSNRAVKLIRQSPRQGKSAGLNKAVEIAKGDIIVFSDANSVYEKRALERLVRRFSDAEIGYVTGRMAYQNPDGSVSGEGCGAYMEYENLIRKLESNVGSVIGVDGGIDAMRRELFIPLRPDHLPDFILPLQVVRQGKRVAFVEDAFLFEDAVSENADEYRMRVRVSLRAFHALWEMRNLLHPKLGLFAFQLFVHKVLRYLIFAFLPLIFLCNAALLDSMLYQFLFAGQVGFYLSAMASWIWPRAFAGRLTAIPFYFCLVNFAAAVAFVKFLKGERQVIWTPRKGA